MNFSFNNQTTKIEVFRAVKEYLIDNQFVVVNIDMERPWGGFFVIDENQAPKFKHLFFEEYAKNSGPNIGKLSPKILIVAANSRLSWQYHHRRSEIWKVIDGEVGVKRSNDDTEGPLETKKVNDLISLAQGERHRLIGLASWGIIAEIWQHTDSSHPSDEEDIVRIQDDFGR